MCNQACTDVGPAMTVVTVTTQKGFLFFERKVDFGAKLSREETKESATNVGPVKNKEKKRERERERERERKRKAASESS